MLFPVNWSFQRFQHAQDGGESLGFGKSHAEFTACEVEFHGFSYIAKMGHFLDFDIDLQAKVQKVHNVYLQFSKARVIVLDCKSLKLRHSCGLHKCINYCSELLCPERKPVS